MAGGTYHAVEAFVWTGGTLLGQGMSSKTVVEPGAVLHIATSSEPKTLDSRTLEVRAGATAFWSGDDAVRIRGGDAGVLLNQGEFVFPGSPLLYADMGEWGLFQNDGRLRKTGDYAAAPDQGAPGATVARLLGVRFKQGPVGSLSVETGAVVLAGAGLAENPEYLRGSVSLGQSSYLEIAGGTFQADSTLSVQGIGGAAPGPLVVTAGALEIVGDVTIPNLELLGGAIAGGGALQVTQALRWSEGRLRGKGSTTVAATANLHMGPGASWIEERLFNNLGTLSWMMGYATFRSDVQPLEPLFTTDEVDLRYVNAADPAWAAFMDALEEAQEAFRQAEERANAAYESHYLSCPPVGPDLYGFDAAYAFDLNQANAYYQIELEAANIAYPDRDEDYWDAVATAEERYDDRLDTALLGASGYLSREAERFQAWQNALQTARDDYRRALNTAAEAFRQALLPARRPGHGSASNRQAELHNLILSAAPAAEVSAFLTGLTQVGRAAVKVAYKRIQGEELLEAMRRVYENTDGWGSITAAYYRGQESDPAGPETRLQESVANARARVNSWGGGIAGWLRGMAADAWDGISGAVVDVYNGAAGAATAAWRGTTGFVRDVSYLAGNDPTALGRALTEGVRDGAVITTNSLTFGAIPPLDAEAQRLVAENGGLYRLSAASANLGRELILTAATMGTTQLAINGATRYVAARFANHPRLLCGMTTAARLYQPVAAVRTVSGMVQGGQRAVDAINRGDYEAAARHIVDVGLNSVAAYGSVRESLRFGRALASGSVHVVRGYLQACFAAGTPILGEHGPKPVESFRPGERVWARDENDPSAPAQLKEIEEVFHSHAPVWHLHAGGRVIRTTAEHPFYVKGKGWVQAQELQAADLLVGRDGGETAVEEVFDTGVWEDVYNFRVAEHHTYFVGEAAWGFSVWAHNTCTIGAYGRLRRDPDRPAGAQVNHVNQDAAYGDRRGAITESCG